MATHNETGKKGEELAASWLEKKGYAILHRNWRHSRYEVDIIATRDNLLHFIEVKTRTNTRFGHPEESVSDKKIENLMEAAGEFMFINQKWQAIQYDILSITLDNNKNAIFFLIEDVYL